MVMATHVVGKFDELPLAQRRDVWRLAAKAERIGAMVYRLSCGPGCYGLAIDASLSGSALEAQLNAYGPQIGELLLGRGYPLMGSLDLVTGDIS